MRLTEDEKYMKEAKKQAMKAYALGEVPIGCVIVCEGKVISRGYNRRNTDKNPLAHAEITAIRKASRRLGDWRLEGCTMYVTLEPCAMCAGAALLARVDAIVFGAFDSVAGCCGSVLDLTDGILQRTLRCIGGVEEETCVSLLRAYFQSRRMA